VPVEKKSVHVNYTVLSDFTCFQKGLSSFGKKVSMGFHAKCAYWWAVTVLRLCIWLLRKS